MRKTISLGLMVLIFASLFVGCKKGANDPFMSLLSRKARLTGVWNLTSAEYENKSVYVSDNVTYTHITYFTYDGSIMTIDSDDEDETYAYSEKITINKDGTFERIIIQDEEYWDGAQTVTGTGTETVTGIWYFIGGSKELDVKNKERVEFLVETYTHDYADPDWDTDYHEYGGKTNAFVYILVLDRLANKEIVALFDYTETDDDGDYEQESGTKTYTRE